MRSAASWAFLGVLALAACEAEDREVETTGAPMDTAASAEELLECVGGCLIYCAHEGTGAGDNIIDDCTLSCMGWTDSASYDCKNALHIFGACAEYYGMHACVEEAPDIESSECAEDYAEAVAICITD